MPTDVTVVTSDDITTVKVNTRHLWDLDLGEMGEQLNCPRLHLDLGEVEILTSMTLGKLILLRRRVQDAGGELVLENVTPAVHEIFQVTRLDRVFDIRQGDQGEDRPLVVSA